MAEDKKIVVILNEKADTVLETIIKKHGLEENEKEILGKVKEHELFNDAIVIHLVRDLLTAKISNKQFFDALHSQFKISSEKTRHLAVDLVDHLVPLLVKIPEDQLEKYNQEQKKKREQAEEAKAEKLKKNPGQGYSKEAFREELLRKIELGKRAPAAPSRTAFPLGAKKPVIQNVEKNAQKILQERIPIVSQPKGTPQGTPEAAPKEERKLPENKIPPQASQYKEEDPYREAPE